MLATFRRAKSSWIFGGLFGFVMLSFMITGVERRMGGVVPQFSDDIASIGGTSISVADAEREARRQLGRLRQQQPELDMARFISSGAFDELIDQMITSKALTVFGRDNGLSVSPRLVDGNIASLPAFQNAAGRFDETTFRQALANAEISEAEMRDDIVTQILQRQLIVPIAADARIPQSIAREYAALLLESRSGSFAAVPAERVGPGKEPSDGEVAAHFQKRQDRYVIPERRVLRYAAFGQAEVAATAAPTDAEIAAYYKQNAANYAARETRTLSQVVLVDQKSAQEFAAKVAGGKSFTQAASEAGFSPADTAVGSQTKADLARVVSAAVANAAFAAAKGSSTPPVRSPLGWHIVNVDAINATPARSLPSVRDEIVAALAKQKSEAALGDLVARIEDRVGDGASFDEAVREAKLQVVETPPVTAAGKAPGDSGYQPPTDLAALLKSGFELTPDDEPVVETITAGQRFALLTVAKVVPAAPPPFESVRQQVKADLVRELSLQRAKAVAEQIAAKVKGGMPLRAAVAGAGIPLPPVQSLSAKRIQISQASGEIPEPLKLMFTLGKGKARVVPAPKAAGYFVVNVEQVVPGNIETAPSLTPLMRNQLNDFVGPEYARQFTAAVKRAVNIDRNDAAIAKLKKQLLQNPGGR